MKSEIIRELGEGSILLPSLIREGLAANDKSLVEGAGLLLTPPDQHSNTQRIFVPRQSIQTLEVLSLIGAAKRRPSAADQPDLFTENS